MRWEKDRRGAGLLRVCRSQASLHSDSLNLLGFVKSWWLRQKQRPIPEKRKGLQGHCNFAFLLRSKVSVFSFGCWRLDPDPLCRAASPGLSFVLILRRGLRRLLAAFRPEPPKGQDYYRCTPHTQLKHQLASDHRSQCDSSLHFVVHGISHSFPKEGHRDTKRLASVSGRVVF